MKYRIIIILLFSCFVLSTNGFGFFHIKNHSNAIRLDHTASDFSTQDNNQFFFYDNYSAPKNDDVLFKKSQGFMPAGKIKIEMPIKILSKTAVSADDSINRMLLANLKINALIEAYKKLQKRAQILLNKPTYGSGENKTAVGSDSNLLEESMSTEKKKKYLVNQIINISNTSHFAKIDGTSNILTISSDQVPDDKNQQIIRNLLFYSSKQQETSSDSGVEQKSLDYFNIKRTIHYANHESSWVFDFVVATINYILNHRLEVVLYIFFLGIFGLFICLKARQ